MEFNYILKISLFSYKQRDELSKKALKKQQKEAEKAAKKAERKVQNVK